MCVVDYLLHDSHFIAVGSNKVRTLWANLLQLKISTVVIIR